MFKSFRGIEPPPRYGVDTSWTIIEIDEAPVPDSGEPVWVNIDSLTVTVEGPPDEPETLDVSTALAVEEVALYRVRFIDEGGSESPYSLATMIPGDDAYDWAPTPARVAAILRARTRGPASRDASIAGEQGEFTATTRPSLTQVEDLIAIACDDLASMFAGRTPCTDSLASSAGAAAAYRAAQLVEVSFFPEQTNGDQTAFAALRAMWEDASKTVAAAISDRCPLVPNPDLPDGDDGGALPAIGVVPVGPLIGRGVIW